MMGSTLRIDSPDEIKEAIARLRTMGDVGVSTILRHGVLPGRVALAGVMLRGQPFPADKLTSSDRPTIVLIGDDDDAATGPLKWRCAKLAGRWAKAVMVHGAGAEEAHYLMAVAAAQEVGRVLIVETSSAYAMSWGNFLSHPRTLLVTTRDNKPHPLPRAAGDLH